MANVVLLFYYFFNYFIHSVYDSYPPVIKKRCYGNTMGKTIFVNSKSN